MRLWEPLWLGPAWSPEGGPFPEMTGVVRPLSLAALAISGFSGEGAGFGVTQTLGPEPAASELRNPGPAAARL